MSRWRVRVASTDYGQAVVYLTNKSKLFGGGYYWNGVEVARLNLGADDAYERLAEAKATAATMARQLTELEA